MKSKFFVFFVLAFVAVAFALTSSVLAEQWYEYSVPDIDWMTVYVDGEAVWFGDCYPDPAPSIDRWICYTEKWNVIGLDRGNTVNVRVSFMANTDLEEATVHTWITGYHKDIEAETYRFDIFAGNTYTKTMNLEIPNDLDARDEYTLYVQIEHQQDLSGIDEAEVDTEVQRISNIIDILSVELYDSSHYGNQFNAGETIYVDTVVKNRGNYEAEDVYVRASINELGIQRTVYIGDLAAYDEDDEDDSKDVTIALALPSNVRAGTYTLEVYAYNDEVSDREIKSIIVSGYKQEQQKEQPEGKVEVVTQISSNKIEQGKGAVYTLLVANFDDITQNFLVETTGTEGWATTTITPSAFSLAPGQSKLVNIYLAASEEAVEGEHIFTARVRYGNEIKQSNLVANVVKSAQLDTKTIFTIVGIILAIVIIVLLILLLTSKHKVKTETVESYY